jgi:hypothetical protein
MELKKLFKFEFEQDIEYESAFLNRDWNEYVGFKRELKKEPEHNWYSICVLNSNSQNEYIRECCQRTFEIYKETEEDKRLDKLL